MAMGMPEIYQLMDGLPPGAWVAISTDQQRVLSYGDDAQTVYDEARRQGEEVPFVGRVPEPDAQMFY